MDRHEPRDLDGVIDEVARAMTDAGLARDLRPAVATRIADASWTRTIGWRAGLAAAGLAVVLVALVPRPTPEPQRPRTVAGGGAQAPVVAPVAVGDPTPAPRRAGLAVTRQTLDDTPVIEEAVDISPVAIVPLEANDAAVLAVPQLVEIAPLDVEPVSISQLELVE